MKRREFWVFKGTSNFCQEMESDYVAETSVKAKPDGFYDVVSSRDTVEGGVHVVEVFPGEDLDEIKAENARLRQALHELDPEWESRDDEVVAPMSSECRIPREYLIRR
jgi:hypothetical protein